MWIKATYEDQGQKVTHEFPQDTLYFCEYRIHPDGRQLVTAVTHAFDVSHEMEKKALDLRNRQVIEVTVYSGDVPIKTLKARLSNYALTNRAGTTAAVERIEFEVLPEN